MRKLVIATLLLPLSIAGSALAIDNGCWNRNMQRMDFYTSPPTSGDTQFFTSVAPKGVIALLFAPRNTMNGFPTSLYEFRTVNPIDPTPTGCTNQTINALRYFMSAAEAPGLQGTFNPALTYPDPEPTYTKVVTVSDGINPALFYGYGQWPNGPPGSTPAATSSATANAACSAAAAADPVLTNLCVACVSGIAARGYWLNPVLPHNDTSARAAVFSGKFLRFYPPKWVLLKLAYKRLLNGPLLASIREGVIAANAAIGGKVLQKLLPNSCQGQGAATGTGILKQKLEAMDTTNYSSAANPLSEMLFNAGYYLSGDDTQWTPSGYFTTSSTAWNVGTASDDGKGGPCPNNPCGQEFVILFSDGRGDRGNPFCTAAGVGPCQAANQCSTVGMKTTSGTIVGEMDGDDFLDPAISGGAGTLVTGAGVRQTPARTCDMDFLDDVAGWMFNNKMKQSFPGRSNVKTFAVGIGSNRYGELEILKQAAARGGGSFVSATDFQSLETGIKTVLQEILQRLTSFSVAAITTVQTRGSTFAFIPRFKPLPGINWEGKLFRFKLFNEFSAGCTATNLNKPVGTQWLNPNGNGSCNDVYLMDADSVNATATPTIPSSSFFDSFVGEDSTGNFVKLNTAQSFPWSPKSPTQSANPVWEAESKLIARVNALNAGTAGIARRNIFTVYDPSGTGRYTTTVQINTDPANLAILTPLFQLEGLGGLFCTELVGATKRTYANETECAADLVRFIRGEDPMFQNSLNQTNPPPSPLYARPNILGDIFHSSPILVTPPTTQFLCDLGVATQCLSSLYNPLLTPNGGPAYASYATDKGRRTQVLLVGANDGMLHAFNAGNDRTGDDPETEGVEATTNHYYDLGTGEEEWAFVPPDLLPKLNKYAIGLRHELFVDGTPMVRDIWVDGSGSTSADRQKQADEFHTVVIFGERGGGRQWTALDVTDTRNPAFLWSWPLPGTTEDLNSAQTWNDHAPSPPPIGPVAVDDSQGPLTVASNKASERYIVAVGGGWDPNLQRGRGFYMLDAWTGQQVYRYARMDSTSSTDLRQTLFPVASTMALLDIDNDGLFDNAVVGDTGGQVWTINMQTPGKDTGNVGYYNNWFTARAFKMASGLALYNMTPFFQMPAAAVLSTGEVRVFLGSGDRNFIKDSTLTSCGLDNLLGCFRRGCTIKMEQEEYDSGSHYVRGTWQWSPNTSATLSINTLTKDSSTTQANACADKIKVANKNTITCNGARTLDNDVMCDWGATTPGVMCPDETGQPKLTQFSDGLISCSSPYLSSGQPCFTPTVTPQNPRFYSIKLYDSSGARARFTTSTAATTYDGSALTDTNLVNADTTAATASGNGWYVTYADRYEKTSSAGLLFGGCMIWNSITPNTTVPADACGASIPLDTAKLFQGDAITGAIQCGSSTQAVRYVSRSVIVPPPMPTPVVSVNPKTDQVTYGGISLEPGNPPLQVSVGGGDIMGMVHWLEVPRPTHDCRHNGANCR
jgi:type IV pilus assembly protein PilY1